MHWYLHAFYISHDYIPGNIYALFIECFYLLWETFRYFVSIHDGFSPHLDVQHMLYDILLSWAFFLIRTSLHFVMIACSFASRLDFVALCMRGMFLITKNMIRINIFGMIYLLLSPSKDISHGYTYVCRYIAIKYNVIVIVNEP